MADSNVWVQALGRSVTIGADRPDYMAGDPPALFFDRCGLLVFSRRTGVLKTKLEYRAVGYEQILDVEFQPSTDLYEHGGWGTSLAGGVLGGAYGVAGAFLGGVLGSGLGIQRDVVVDGLWVNVMVDPASPKLVQISFLDRRLNTSNRRELKEIQEICKHVDECIAKVRVAMDMAAHTTW